MTKRFEMPCVNGHGVCTEHVLAYVVVVVNITSNTNVITNCFINVGKVYKMNLLEKYELSQNEQK